MLMARWNHSSCGVYIWKWSPAHALAGVSGVAYFIIIDEELQLNLGCCFLHAGYASLGLSIFLRFDPGVSVSR